MAVHVLGNEIAACRNGVSRAHLLDRHDRGAVLLELYTRDGVGTMVYADPYDATRAATIEDIGGILGLSLANAVFVDEMMMDNTEYLERKVDALTEEIRRRKGA